MAKLNKSKVIKGKKKWFPVLASDIFDNASIGETLQYDPENAVGTTVETNLMNLTRNIKNQNVNVKFLITHVKENKLYTKTIQYSIISASLKRLVRRHHHRLDDSFVLKTKDNISMRIKPLLITRGRATSSVKVELRSKLKELITKYVKETDYDSIFKNIIFYKFQKELKEQLNKLYPLKSCEIRIIKQETITKEKKPTHMEKTKEPEKIKDEELEPSEEKQKTGKKEEKESKEEKPDKSTEEPKKDKKIKEKKESKTPKKNTEVKKNAKASN
ncbi:hypothetical protein JXB41_07020 [Candidatus Woesearchaeota archaeon]|nr:hypothetical protein [Candidatus Woesearchaeota archaeon]